MTAPSTTAPAPTLNNRAQSVLDAYIAHHSDDYDGPERIRAAHALAERAHRGQLRATGEPYIIHPVAVAQTIADLGMDAETVIAALCHDVVEDTPVTGAELAAQFGPTAAELVDGVTKLSAVTAASREQNSAANLRKLLVAATKDPRVLILKVADRLHNASTLAPLPESKRTRVARETLDVYAPIAHRLGMNETAAALEDAAFAALHPELFTEVSAHMDAMAPAREEKLARIKDTTERALRAAGIPAAVTSRGKHVYSTWRKTQVRKQPLERIADLIGVRVIVDDVPSCYGALGVLHGLFAPVPARIRDYIAQPRFGQYQSLHTTVSVDGVLTEVQIRTWAMHANAEHGIAAHWRYKDQSVIAAPDGGPTLVTAPDLPWLAQLIDTGLVEAVPAEDFLDAVRHDLGADEVVVFTPTGKPLALPEGATALDAAYAVHTELGHQSVAVLVNDLPAARGTVLRPGDRFEVLSNPDQHPAESWLNDAVTGRARHAIKHALNTQSRTEARLAATELLNADIRRVGVSRGWTQVASLHQVAAELGYENAESLLDAFAAESTLAPRAAQRIRELVDADPTHTRIGLIDPAESFADGTLIMDGVHEGLLVTAASCCTPASGHDAIAVTGAAGQLIVHQVDCLELARTSAPLYDVTYAPTLTAATTRIHAAGLARRGLLADACAAVEQTGATVVSMQATTTNNTVCLDLHACAVEPDALWKAVEALRNLHGVYQVHEEPYPHTG